MQKNIGANAGRFATSEFCLTGLLPADELTGSWTEAHADFLSGLSEAETSDLLHCASRRLLRPRDQLFGVGDHSNDVYILAEGCIRLFQLSPSGRETILWFSFPGEIFGIAELCSGSHREIYAVANEASEVYAIRRRDFAAFLGRHPEAAMRAIGILSARVRALGDSLVGLATDNVETRIARLLMRFASAPAVTEQHGEWCVKVRLTHQDIANMIGASRQTVTSTLLQLRKLGAVRMVDRHIRIARMDYLHQLLEVAAE